MHPLMSVVRVELYKLFRSYIFWIVGGLCMLIPIVASLFMYALQHPHIAAQMGLLGQKAQFANEASWTAFFDVQSQMIAVGGIIAFSFITSWMFGREFVHGTVKDLLALPYSRTIVVFAKFFCTFIASFFLVFALVIIGIACGLLLQLDSFTNVSFSSGFFRLLFVALCTIALCLPAAFFASFSRGYLAPFGYILFVLIFSQLIIAVGYGEYFPWALPALYSGISGTPFDYEFVHYLYIIVTSILGIVATIYYWEYADHDE
ncbi:MAG TPA: ABC transporter permease [Pseudogracilibacillus sp.]|nr:ABC transporter permease [Pseudogracilibacillus sp.]